MVEMAVRLSEKDLWKVLASLTIKIYLVLVLTLCVGGTTRASSCAVVCIEISDCCR